jgi:hypothetical protein
MARRRIPENTSDYARWLAGEIANRSGGIRLSPTTALFVGMALEGYAGLLDQRESTKLPYIVTAIDHAGACEVIAAAKDLHVATAVFTAAIVARPGARSQAPPWPRDTSIDLPQDFEPSSNFGSGRIPPEGGKGRDLQYCGGVVPEKPWGGNYDLGDRSDFEEDEDVRRWPMVVDRNSFNSTFHKLSTSEERDQAWRGFGRRGRGSPNYTGHRQFPHLTQGITKLVDANVIPSCFLTLEDQI